MNKKVSIITVNYNGVTDTCEMIESLKQHENYPYELIVVDNGSASLNDYTLLKEKYPDEKIIEYHGIAYDEIERSKKNNEKNIQYPLINWNMTEKECLQYCYEKGFTWKGLYEKFDRVSCWCCPLKNLKELKILYKTYPELWNRLKIWERKTYRKFRSDYTVEELEKKFKREDQQIRLPGL